MSKTIRFKLNSEVKLPRSMVYAIPESGPADEAIEGIRASYQFEVEPSDAVEYLKSTGAWEASDLKDHDQNINRLVWLACLDCREQKTLYWYMGS